MLRPSTALSKLHHLSYYLSPFTSFSVFFSSAPKMKPQNEALHAPKKPSQDAELASSATPAPSPLLAPPKPAPLASTNTPKRMTLPPIPISSFLLPVSSRAPCLRDLPLPTLLSESSPWPAMP